MNQSIATSFAAEEEPGDRAVEETLDGRFERIFRQYAPYVHRVLPRMGIAPADRDDVAQEVFLAVHRGLPKFERRSSEKTWVYGICIRVCHNFRRRAHRRHERVGHAVPDLRESRTPERHAVAHAALARLDAALHTLPEAQRATFVLHEIEALSVKEIAAALGCSKFTVYGRLATARRNVRSAMRESPVQEPTDA